MSRPDLPGLPRDAAGAPVFPTPTAARAFAIAVALNEAGAFEWRDFSAALAEARAREPDGDYFAAWLTALEAVLAARGIAGPEAVAALTDTWRRAARATPHGQPIRLENAGQAAAYSVSRAT